MKVPEPLVRKLTLPEGVIGVPASVSVTVAVQIVGALTVSVERLQLTTVLVTRFAAVRLNVPELVE